MTPDTLKRAQTLTSTIAYLDHQIESIKDANKIDGMGITHISFELPDPLSYQERCKTVRSHDAHYESVSLGELPSKTQQEIFAVVAKTTKSKLQYRRRIAIKELKSL